jgi:hypothetical protein
MRTSLKLGVIIASLLLAAAPASAQGSHRVRGHTTKRGTYVAPHRQTNPDRSTRNNWSTRGNRNPYTGRAGTKTSTGRRRR